MFGRRSTSVVLTQLSKVPTLFGSPKSHKSMTPAIQSFPISVGPTPGDNSNDPQNIRHEQASLLSDATTEAQKIPGSGQLGYFQLLKTIHDKFWKLEGRLNAAEVNQTTESKTKEISCSEDEIISQEERRRTKHF